MPERDWSQYPTHPTGADLDKTGSFALPDNGWGALIAWLAGPTRTLRVPWGREGATVQVTLEHPPGNVVHQEIRPLNVLEAQELDDDTDAYLVDAGMPPRPRGFAWHLVLPPDIASEEQFWSTLNVALESEAPDARHPVDVTAAMRQILHRLYTSDRT